MGLGRAQQVQSELRGYPGAVLYFFLPQDWSPGEGAAIIVPRSESMRLEFTTASSSAPCGA
ncbi:hypothetical protein [Kibdelosporangium aridum]|uniref:hypothetical protein n=1 Tax=Kibdelosporangium aridum TaxID=2030 RepID=UPI000F781640|nr:hypothetical protein [Kibdelosporangium aridum]